MTTVPSPHVSGNNYVAARLRKPDPGDPGRNKILKIRIGPMVRFKCTHEHTICVECAREWNQDYAILLYRTKGGRDLAEKMKAAGVDMRRFPGYDGK